GLLGGMDADFRRSLLKSVPQMPKDPHGAGHASIGELGIGKVATVQLVPYNPARAGCIRNAIGEVVSAPNDLMPGYSLKFDKVGWRRRAFVPLVIPVILCSSVLPFG